MSPLPTSIPAPRRRAAVLVSALLAVLIVGAVLALAPDAPGSPRATGSSPDAEPAAEAATVPDGPLTLVVDPSLQPDLAEVDGLDDGDDPRPVGRIRDAGGTDMDVVLGELVVVSESAEQLDAFVERWDAEIVHSYEPEPDGSQDHLVRIDGDAVVDAADPAVLAEVAAGLVAMEPYHSGEMALGDASLVGLLAVIAHETNEGGPVVSPNFVGESTGIAERSMVESSDRADAWGWSYLRNGGALDYGVTGAWELLGDAGHLDRGVNVLIFDGGFAPIDDLPYDPTLRGAQWGDSNPGLLQRRQRLPLARHRRGRHGRRRGRQRLRLRRPRRTGRAPDRRRAGRRRLRPAARPRRDGRHRVRQHRQPQLLVPDHPRPGRAPLQLRPAPHEDRRPRPHRRRRRQPGRGRRRRVLRLRPLLGAGAAHALRELPRPLRRRPRADVPPSTMPGRTTAPTPATRPSSSTAPWASSRPSSIRPPASRPATPSGHAAPASPPPSWPASPPSWSRPPTTPSPPVSCRTCWSAPPTTATSAPRSPATSGG